MSKGSNRRPGDKDAFDDAYSKIFTDKPKRGSFVWDSEKGEMVPKSEYHSRYTRSTMILPDIQPYKSMATGEMIGGRSQHREHMKRHNLIEIGNETKYLKNERKQESPSGLRERIAQVAYDKLK